MTVYNGTRFIGEAIDSILNQTFKDFEFVIVDNNSTDGSQDIIASYKDDRIIFIRNKENLGQTKALNIGVRQARGEFIARMDADDISLPQRLEKQYEFLLNNPSIAVVGAHYLEMTEEGKTIREFRMPRDPLEIKCFLLGSFALCCHCVPHPIVLMRKAALVDVGLYNEEFIAQDYDLWVKLSRKYLFSNVNEVLFKYRLARSAQSQNLRHIYQKENAQVILRNIEHYWPELNNERKKSLWLMLNFYPQEKETSGTEVLDVFDEFFAKAVSTYQDRGEVIKTKRKIKFFYTPVLFISHPLFALHKAILFILQCPTLLFEKKFYAKILKSFQQKNNRSNDLVIQG